MPKRKPRLVPETITVKDAADLLDIAPAGVRYHIELGHFAASKPGRDWLIDRASLERWVESCRVGPGAPAGNQNAKGKGRPKKKPPRA